MLHSHLRLGCVTSYSQLRCVMLHSRLRLGCVTSYSQLRCVMLHSHLRCVTSYSQLRYVMLHSHLRCVTSYSHLRCVMLHSYLRCVTSYSRLRCATAPLNADHFFFLRCSGGVTLWELQDENKMFGMITSACEHDHMTSSVSVNSDASQFVSGSYDHT